MSRFSLPFGLALCLSVSTASDVVAQRSGFIIGFGVGPGVAVGDPTVDNAVGLATDFKIGAMLGESIQLYYSGKWNLLLDAEDLVATGVGGLGVTYQMASGFNINGSVGLATYTDFDNDRHSGFGLGAGFGYEFADLWVLNLGGTWGILDDDHIINIAATISILSH